MKTIKFLSMLVAVAMLGFSCSDDDDNGGNGGNGGDPNPPSGLPALPDDSQPESTSFVHRVLLTQITGTGCGFCPLMISAVEKIMEDAEYGDKAVLTVAHRYNNDDPAWCPAPLDKALGVSGAPWCGVDLVEVVSNQSVDANVSNLKRAIDKRYNASPAKAGIAASTELDGDVLVVRMAVKAAETGTFRVGCWLLEDGIQAQQSNYQGVPGNFNTHNNCVRIADSKASATNYSGVELGTVEQGKIGEKVFAMSLKGYKKENCKLVLFVSAAESGKYTVNNAVSCPLEGTVAFEYAK